MLDDLVASHACPFSSRVVEVRRVAVCESQSSVWVLVGRERGCLEYARDVLDFDAVNFIA